MNTLANSFIALANGIFASAHHLVSPITVALVVIGASLAWIARIEVEELNRKGTKPHIGIH